MKFCTGRKNLVIAQRPLPRVLLTANAVVATLAGSLRRSTAPATEHVRRLTCTTLTPAAQNSQQALNEYSQKMVP